MDCKGRVLVSATVSEVWPSSYLAVDRECNVFVADVMHQRVVLLSCDLRLERILTDKDAEVKLWQPVQLSYNERKSQLYVVHGSEPHFHPFPDTITLLSLR